MVLRAPTSSDRPRRVAGKRDDVGDAGLRGQRNIFAEGRFDGCVILDAIHGVGDRAAARVAHGTEESVAARDFEFVDFEQVDAFEAEAHSPTGIAGRAACSGSTSGRRTDECDPSAREAARPSATVRGA